MVEVARPTGGVVVDVATGAGHTAFAFAPYVDRVIATDITPQMLGVTRDAAAERSIANINVVFAQAEALPFPTGSLEGVTCRLGAHHFRDVHKFVIEVGRVLHPSGWFLLVDNVGVEEDDEADDLLDKIEFQRDRSHVRYYRTSVWEKMLTGNGFKIDFLETVPKPLNAYDWLRRQRVPEGLQQTILQMITESTGWLRHYLRPHGEGELLTFHLSEMLVLARRQ